MKDEDRARVLNAIADLAHRLLEERIAEAAPEARIKMKAVARFVLVGGYLTGITKDRPAMQEIFRNKQLTHVQRVLRLAKAEVSSAVSDPKFHEQSGAMVDSLLEEVAAMLREVVT